MVIDITHFDTGQVISLVLGVGLPLLTGWVTRWDAHPGLRGVVLLGLSALSAVLTELGDVIASGKPYDLGAVIVSALATFVVGVAFHSGLYRPTGIATKITAVGGFIGGTSTEDRRAA